ncbi:hypothetical protein [Cytophaga hutchinsonii]|nr:hypothetical protein [Cytophaga hutchinsonii]SFX53880.1 hypothetical protein SAMN04487930_105172 [Cytophaga hutchinsonii ATCC 33406]
MIRFKDIHIPIYVLLNTISYKVMLLSAFAAAVKNYVYDFRGKDQPYLNTVFAANGNVCGIYYADQIQAC